MESCGLGPIVSPYIVDPQCFEIANVQSAICNHWTRKRFLRHLPHLFFLDGFGGVTEQLAHNWRTRTNGY